VQRYYLGTDQVIPNECEIHDRISNMCRKHTEILRFNIGDSSEQNDTQTDLNITRHHDELLISAISDYILSDTPNRTFFFILGCFRETDCLWTKAFCMKRSVMCMFALQPRAIGDISVVDQFGACNRSCSAFLLTTLICACLPPYICERFP
jgi:hypothetical protein